MCCAVACSAAGPATSLPVVLVRAERANETVAALGERLDEARRLRRVTQRFPQALDGVVQPAIEIDEGVRRPDLPLELVPRHDLAGVVQQNAE